MSRLLRRTLALGLVLAPAGLVAGLAVPLTIFSNGEIADADQVNANFDALGAALDANVAKANLSATTDPSRSDDAIAGFGHGSVWVNTITKAVFVLVDPANGAAVWTPLANASLRLHVPFDDGVGAVAIDRERKVVLDAPGVTWLSSGCVSGGCIRTDGTSYVRLMPAALAMHGLRDFTISYWLRKTGAVGIEPSRYVLSLATPSNDNTLLASAPTGTGGLWQQFVVRRSGSTLSLFRDGAFVPGAVSGLGPPTDASSSSLMLAQDQDSVGGGLEPSQSWAGDIDEFKIYDCAFSDAEIAAGLP